MNSVTELFRSLTEIAVLVVSLAVLAVILQSANTSQVIGTSAKGFSGVLATAMGQVGSSGGIGGGMINS